MEQENPPTFVSEEPKIPPPERQLDPIRVNEFKEKMKEEQRPLMAILAGGLAAVLGAVIWAAVIVVTQYQIGWMAIGVGFLVGWSVRKFGKGVDRYFGIIGAGLALFGCVLGNLFAIAALISQQESMGILSVVGLMILNPDLTFEILKESFSVIDLLFYGFAIYYGYRHSFRVITQAEVAQLYKA